MAPVKSLLTTLEVVELLASHGVEISAETVRRWGRDKRLKAVGTRGRTYFRREQVLDLYGITDAPATSVDSVSAA